MASFIYAIDGTGGNDGRVKMINVVTSPAIRSIYWHSIVSGLVWSISVLFVMCVWIILF